MRRAKVPGALVGVESVTHDGLKDVYKGFNLAGEELVYRLRAFRGHGIHVLGSFIFGLPSDTKDSFARPWPSRNAPTSRLRNSSC